MPAADFPHLGFGCGLRPAHQADFLKGRPSGIDWVEAIAENFLDWSDGTRLRHAAELEKVRANTPVALHGVSLSLGSAQGLDLDHLKRLRALIKRVDATWFSDHLCWTGPRGHNLHDLYPLPYTREAIDVACQNIDQAQNALGQPLLIENVSTYAAFEDSEMPEWEFINEVLSRSGCGLLLDVNNVYVNSRNHGFDPLDYLRALPPGRIGMVHLAGHRDKGTHLFDTHDTPVCDAVWELYAWVCAHLGRFSTLIEWDDHLPPLSVLVAHAERARQLSYPLRQEAPVERSAHLPTSV